MANEDEIEKLNTVRDEMNHDEHKKIINEILSRQPEDIKDKVYKFYQVIHFILLIKLSSFLYNVYFLLISYASVFFTKKLVKNIATFEFENSISIRTN